MIPDGIEVKEGILLDREDNPIEQPAQPRRTQALAFSLGPWIGGALLILVIFAGITFFGAITAVILGLWLIRTLLGLFGIGRIRR